MRLLGELFFGGTPWNGTMERAAGCAPSACKDFCLVRALVKDTMML